MVDIILPENILDINKIEKLYTKLPDRKVFCKLVKL